MRAVSTVASCSFPPSSHFRIDHSRCDAVRPDRRKFVDQMNDQKEGGRRIELIYQCSYFECCDLFNFDVQVESTLL